MPSIHAQKTIGAILDGSRSLLLTQMLQRRCEGRWSDNAVSDVAESAMATFYRNTPEYNAYVGKDLVPENRYLWGRTSNWGPKFDYTSPKRAVRLQECFVDEEDGSPGGWRVFKMGHFTTEGDYAWIQIGFDDLWRLESLINVHSNGVVLTQQVMSAIDTHGVRIGHPPIHIHHMHASRKPSVRERLDPMHCAVYNETCYDPTRYVQCVCVLYMFVCMQSCMYLWACVCMDTDAPILH